MEVYVYSGCIDSVATHMSSWLCQRTFPVDASRRFIQFLRNTLQQQKQQQYWDARLALSLPPLHIASYTLHDVYAYSAQTLRRRVDFGKGRVCTYTPTSCERYRRRSIHETAYTLKPRRIFSFASSPSAAMARLFTTQYYCNKPGAIK